MRRKIDECTKCHTSGATNQSQEVSTFCELQFEIALEFITFAITYEVKRNTHPLPPQLHPLLTPTFPLIYYYLVFGTFAHSLFSVCLPYLPFPLSRSLALSLSRSLALSLSRSLALSLSRSLALYLSLYPFLPLSLYLCLHF